MENIFGGISTSFYDTKCHFQITSWINYAFDLFRFSKNAAFLFDDAIKKLSTVLLLKMITNVIHEKSVNHRPSASIEVTKFRNLMQVQCQKSYRVIFQFN